MNSTNNLLKRTIMMVVGIAFISLCVGLYRLSGFGVDAFTCMNLGISGFLDMQFGTWQLIMNAFILIVVFFTARECIGAGTIVNMVGVGYGADLLCWLVQDVGQVEMTLPLRIGALALGSIFAGLGVALYIVAEMGVAPYDSVAIIIEKDSFSLCEGGKRRYRGDRRYYFLPAGRKFPLVYHRSGNHLQRLL